MRRAAASARSPRSRPAGAQTTTAGNPERGHRPPGRAGYSAMAAAMASMSAGMPPSHCTLSAVGGETDDTVTGS